MNQKHEKAAESPERTANTEQTPKHSNVLTHAVGAAALLKFAQAMKDHLWVANIGIVDGDNPWANGNTEQGFYPDKVVDYDALCREIDQFTQSFIEGKVA